MKNRWFPAELPSRTMEVMFVEDTSGARKNVSKCFLEFHRFTPFHRFKRCWEAPAEGMEQMLQIKTTWPPHKLRRAICRCGTWQVASVLCDVYRPMKNVQWEVPRSTSGSWLFHFFNGLEQHCQASEESLKLLWCMRSPFQKRTWWTEDKNEGSTFCEVENCQGLLSSASTSNGSLRTKPLPWRNFTSQQGRPMGRSGQ